MQYRRQSHWGIQTDQDLFTRNSARSHLKPFAWNLGTACILYSEPLLGTLEPSESFTWNLLRTLKPEPLRGTMEPSLGTLARNLVEPSLGTSEPLKTFTWNFGYLGTLEPPGSLTWNPYLEPRGTFRNLYLEPLLEPWNLLDPWLRALTWNLAEPSGTFTWNPYLERRNLAEPCGLPQSAPGLVWLRPQSFQLLGN